MVNYNGELFSNTTKFLNQENRGLRYGDALFESMRFIPHHIPFWEDHYLRLMSSMRMLRMEIPMNFTMEFLQEQIAKTVEANNLQKGARLRVLVFRDDGGLYNPLTNTISYIIQAEPLESPFYVLEDGRYEVELFKDFYVNPDILSTLKTNNKIIHVLGSIFAKENDYDNCLLLNHSKQVVEALSGNLFMVNGTVLITPPIKDGCLNGIIRKKLIEIVNKLDGYTIDEKSISPFDLQKADELFITNAVIGIRPITKYRKKVFETSVSKGMLGKLNASARLN